MLYPEIVTGNYHARFTAIMPMSVSIISSRLKEIVSVIADDDNKKPGRRR